MSIVAVTGGYKKHMSLRTKAFLIVVVPLAAFLAILYLVISGVAGERFEEIEFQRARENAGRAAGAIKGECIDLSRLAADWGNWDASYRFVAGEDSDFKGDLIYPTFEDIGINFIAIVDRRGRTVFSSIYDLDEKVAKSPPPEFVGRISPESPILKGMEKPVSGLLRTSEGLMLVGINPILTTEGKGPSRGLIAMGRFLKAGELKILRDILQLPFELVQLNNSKYGGEWEGPIRELQSGRSIVVERMDKKTLASYTTLTDISGKPVVAVRVLTSGDLSLKARSLVIYITLFMLGAGLVFILLTQITIQRFVVDPIRRLVSAAAGIGNDSNLSLRIPEGGGEELSSLARSINEMLGRVEKASAEVVRVQKAREDFTSIVSHEIRAPLSTIKEGVGLIAEGADGPVTASQRATLDIIRRNVDRMNRLIGNILDISRLESGRLSIKLEDVDVRHLVSEVCTLMLPSAERKGLKLALSLPPDEVQSRCDPERIKQVLFNLIDNAVKFTEKGKIEMRVSSGNDFVRIEIKDEGAGIPKADMEHIFERFRQGSGDAVRRRAGSGLGLSICKHIVERHNGSISVTSQENKGSTFAVELPLDPPEPSGSG